MKSISLLGSTGSIGKNVLNVVRSFPDRFRVVGLSAGRNITELAVQVQEFQPECISVADQSLAAQLIAMLPEEYREKVFWGEEGNRKVATVPAAEMVVSAVVGAAGFCPPWRQSRRARISGLLTRRPWSWPGDWSWSQLKNIRLLSFL